jgi:hypothetical protein
MISETIEELKARKAKELKAKVLPAISEMLAAGFSEAQTGAIMDLVSVLAIEVFDRKFGL